MKAERRVEALRAKMSSEGITAMVVSETENIAYLTGFEGVFDDEQAHVAVISADAPLLFTDTRYRDAACAAAEATDWNVEVPTDNIYVAMCESIKRGGHDVFAVEAQIPYGRFKFISERFEGRVEAVDNWVEEIRQVKEPEEIERIAAAQRITDDAFAHILDFVRPGVTEAEIGLELEVFMRRKGSEGVAFTPIVASGPNSALPHAKMTSRAVSRGDFVKMDFGARVRGYCADMTRTVVMGGASDEQRSIYETVLAANLAGTAAVRAGVPGNAIDAAARAVIDSAGYGERFGHGLGHGVGRQVHELPGVGPRGVKSVKAGSVITIEPGIYVPGFGGVRIEDLVVVEETGARVLTTSAKDLIELQ